jgi:hypothetical protein
MKLADEMAAKIATIRRQSAGPASDPDDMLHELDQRLRATLKGFQRTSNRPKPVEDLRSDDKLNEQPEDFPYTNHQAEPVEYLHSDDKLNEQPENFPHTNHQAKPGPSIIPRIRDRLDDETSDRVRPPKSQTKRRAPRGFTRYFVAICIGVAGTLAWQSYGEATKQIIAANAPALGWSPEAKQMIASWVQQLGWSKPSASPENAAVQLPVPKMPQAAPVAQANSETVASTSTTPATPSLDQKQAQQMEADIAAVQQTLEQRLATVRASVEQLAVGQDQVLREIAKLHQEILNKTSAPSPQLSAAPVPKPKPAPTSPSRAPALPPSGESAPLQLSPHP